jgi:SAM-dependent methyltransferase
MAETEPTHAVSTSAQSETLDRMAEAKRYNAWLLDRARPHVGPRVLDVGAGLGTFTELLAPGSELVVSLEPDPAFADALRSRFAGWENVSVLETGVEELDAAALPERFDSIVCFNVLEHVADDRAALARFHAVLRPGGSLLLLVPAHPVLFGAVDSAVGHERRYRRRALERLLVETGFDIAELRYANPVGAAGWLVSSRLLRRADISSRALGLYDRVVPVLRALDRARLPFGLSLWAVARR